MSDREDMPKRRRTGVWVGASLLAVCLLYLAFAPVLMSLEHKRMVGAATSHGSTALKGSRLVDAVLTPAGWLMVRVKPYYHYVCFCMEKAGITPTLPWDEMQELRRRFSH